MSVINDMLRDLEQRKAPDRDTAAGSGNTSLINDDSKNRMWPVFAFGIALAIGAATAVFFLWAQYGANQSGSALVKSGSPVNAVTPEVIETANIDINTDVDISRANPAESADRLQRAESVQQLDKGPQADSAIATPSPESLELPASKPIALARQSTSVNSQDDAASKKLEPEIQASSKQPQKPVDLASSPDLENVLAVASKEPTRLRAKPTTNAVPASNASIQRQPNLAQPVIVSAESGQSIAANELADSLVALTPIARDQKVAASAARLIKKGESEQARRLLYDFISANDPDNYSRVTLAKHLIQNSRMAEAGDLLVGVTDKDAPELKAIKARWLVKNGQVNDALGLLAARLPDVRQHSEYYALLASFYQQQGQFEQAIDTYSTLLEFDSNIADWWVGMGIGLDQMQRYDDAVLAYRQALALPNLKGSLASFSQSRLQQLTL